MAEHLFLAVLYARVLVFQAFLECALELRLAIASLKPSWLLLQLRPKTFFGTDIFHDIAKDVGRCSSLAELLGHVHERLTGVEQLLGAAPLFCVLDDAHTAKNMLFTCFGFDDDPNRPGPVIRSLVDTFATMRHIIISGADISIRTLKTPFRAAVAKDGAETMTVTAIGAFDCEADQIAYIKHYLPHNSLYTSSGQHWLKRVAFWLRRQYVEIFPFTMNADPFVRHGLTALYLTRLLQNSLESPHRTLDDFVEGVTKVRPSDGEHIVKHDAEDIEDVFQVTDPVSSSSQRVTDCHGQMQPSVGA
jgi:hypothetical protein